MNIKIKKNYYLRKRSEENIKKINNLKSTASYKTISRKKENLNMKMKNFN